MVQEPSVQSGGRTWTRAQADAAYLVGSLEEDAYLTLVGELAAVRNGVLAPIYLELVKVRNQYAASKGYDDYVQYAYQTVYGRTIRRRRPPSSIARSRPFCPVWSPNC